MGCAMAEQGQNFLLEKKGNKSEGYENDEEMNPDGLTKTKLQESKILLSATHRVATNSPRDVPILSKCDSECVKMPVEAFCSQRLLSILAV